MEKENVQNRPADRIRQLAQWYIDHKVFRGMATFEGASGLSARYVKNLCGTTHGNPGVDTIASIYKTFRGVSLEWLVLGDGEMFTVSEDDAVRYGKDAVADFEKEAKVRSILNNKKLKGMTREEKLALMRKIWCDEK